MEKYPKFKRAPCREAIIDLRFESKLNLNDLSDESFSKTILDLGYQHPQPITESKFSFVFNPTSQNSSTAASEPEIKGYKFDNPSNSFVVQFKADSFTLSKLHPYTEFPEVKAEAQRLFEVLPKSASINKFSRVAVRYVNEILLPLDLQKTINYDLYLVNGPSLPNEMGDVVEGFFTRVVIPVNEYGARVIINQTFEAPRNDKIPYILDIDAFSGNLESIDRDKVWEYLEILRNIKNKAFFGSIHKNTIQIIEKEP